MEDLHSKKESILKLSVYKSLSLLLMTTSLYAENPSSATAQNASVSTTPPTTTASTTTPTTTTQSTGATTTATPPTTAAPVATPAPRALTLVQQLLQRLTLKDGSSANIVVFDPIDDSKNKVGKDVANQVVNAFKNYGPLNARSEMDPLSGLTLEQFRLLMARHHADILIGLVTRDTHFTMYMYDRRTPYYVYAHTEQIPEPARANLNPLTTPTYTRLLVRRLLFRFLNNQYFELPRDDSPPVLKSEIPKWVASEDALAVLNRELDSHFYGTLSVGAMLTMGQSKQIWNSNLVGGQIGIRVYKKIFVEVAANAASYNVFTGSIKYLDANRDHPFQLMYGLGATFASRDKVWNLDQTLGLGKYSYYITPSAAILWPIGDVYLKIETQLSISLGFNRFIFTVAPGLSFYF